MLLEPTGHVSALVRVVRHEDTVFTLDLDAGFADEVIVRLQRFVLRAKVTLRRSDWVVRAFRGPDAVREVGAGPGRANPYWGSEDEVDVVGDVSLVPLQFCFSTARTLSVEQISLSATQLFPFGGLASH